MCGRFANGLPPDQLRQAVRSRLPRNVRLELDANADDYRPGHNVAPQTRSPVVRLADGPSGSSDANVDVSSGGPSTRAVTGGDNEEEIPVLMQTMKWGLVPKTAKVPPTGLDAARTINARDDTITAPHGSMWSPLFASSQRAVVFIQGFYEWEHKERPGGKEDVIAHFIGLDDEGEGRKDRNGRQKSIMALAGLWEKVRFHGDEEDTWTFTLVTTSANKQMHFHERMPVILPDERSIALWLGLSWSDNTSTAVVGRPPLKEVAALMRPYPRSLEVYPCPREVGKVGTDSSQYILPISERKDGIMAAFKRAEKKDKPKASDSSEKVIDRSGTKDGEESLESQRKGMSAAELTEPQASSENAEKNPRKRSASPLDSTPPTKRQHQSSSAPTVSTSSPSTSHGVKKEITPSSRFSPDPWNPPPDDEDKRRKADSSNKKSTPKASPKKKALEQAAKGTKDIRSFFG